MSTTSRSSSARLAVIGAGGIGGYTAALAHWAGLDVTLCVRTPVDGLTVTLDGTERHAAVPVVTDPAQAGPVDWVLLTTKAQDTPSAAPWLRALCGPGTTVAVLQNGTGLAERVAPYIPEGTATLPVICYLSAERTAPGRIVHHLASELHVPQGPSSEAFAALLDGTGLNVTQVPDFTTATWRKVFFNLAANPLTALLGQRMDIFREAEMTALARALLTEAAEVARAEGADVGESDIAGTLEIYAAAPPGGGSSMLYDREAGRPLEHEYLTGAVVAAGERHSLPTPLNRMLLTLLRAVDRDLRTTGAA
ncbi:2-dehydropantoate 2-reductase [Streptomyces sp. NPDC014733]|uniref:2-dehydropantoate 2-reductase n=1 Tax=Streptomyces sp. NPDC014733 TaxID=3364885 RepID=UPI0036FA0BE5